jgi:hypothetical protein
MAQRRYRYIAKAGPYSPATIEQVHVDQPMTNLSIMYANTANYIAQKCFPVIPTDKRSDIYYVYNKADFLRRGMRKRAPASESAGGGFSLSHDPYFTNTYSEHIDLDDQTLANCDTPIDLVRDNTRFLTKQMLLEQDAQLAEAYLTTGKWDFNPTITYKWDNLLESDPIGDIINMGVIPITQVTDYAPNSLILGISSWQTLRFHPQLIDLIKYNGNYDATQGVTQKMLAAIFELDNVYVMRATNVVTEEGAAEDLYQFVAPNSAFVAYINPTPGLMQPSAGYCFMWRGAGIPGLAGPNAPTIAMKNYRIEAIASQRVEIQAAWDFRVVAPAMGSYYDDVVTGTSPIPG